MQKGFTSVIIIIALLAAAGVGGLWFLYAQKQSLIAEKNDLRSKLAERDVYLDAVKNEKIRSERELAVLTASGIVKEVKILRIKFKDVEENLAKVRGEVAPLEATMANIRLYADAVAAFDQNLAPSPPTPLNANLQNLGVRISVLNDSEVTDLWRQAKSDIDAGGNGGSNLIRAYFLIISKILKLLS